MEIRVLGIADRPPAVMLLEGGYRLVLLLLGHDTSFLHAHGARRIACSKLGVAHHMGTVCVHCNMHAAYSRARIGHQRAS
jgi:hypothetical protein